MAKTREAAAPPRTQGDAADLTEAMVALRGLMLAGDQFRHAAAAYFDVGLSETVAMSHLSMAGPLSPREVSDRVGLTPSTVTSLLDRLEHAGLTARTPPTAARSWSRSPSTA